MPFTISNRPWPAHRPRTQADNIRHAGFTPKTFGKAAHAATKQIHGASGYDVIISTACPFDFGLNEDDFTPYMDDQGVVVHASFDGGVRVFTCDRWVHLTHNLWAIAQHIKAVRDQADWGVATVAEALAAFRMLPEHTEARDCYPVLGVPATASRADIQAAYRAHALVLHPDSSAVPPLDSITT